MYKANILSLCLVLWESQVGGKTIADFSKVFKVGDTLSSSVESEVHLKENNLDIDNGDIEQADVGIKLTYP